MRGNPSGNFVPECEPRKGASWRLTEFDAASDREDSAESSDTCSLVLDSICYTKVKEMVQGGEQKKLHGGCAERILGSWSDGCLARHLMLRTSSWTGGDARRSMNWITSGGSL